MKHFFHFLVFFFSLFLVFQQTFASFPDVSSNHLFRDAIDYVQSEQIVSGYPDGNYQPDRTINRAEFTKIIIGSRFSASEIDTCLSTPDFYEQKLFSDVEKEEWFSKYVCMAKKEGVISGYPDGSFKPANTINVAEAAKIVIKSYGLKTPVSEPWYKPFLDTLTTKDALPKTLQAITTLSERASQLLTRGEMADIIYRLRLVNDTVSSSDGSFSMKVLETSLPDGISHNQISVKKLPPEENPAEEVGGAPMVFYQLEPDGLQFQKPIHFEITADAEDKTIPLVFLISKGSFETLKDPEIIIDQSTRMLSLRSELSHFSFLGVVKSESLASLSFAPISNKGLHKPFQTQVTVASEGQRSFLMGNKTFVFDGNLRLYGGEFVSAFSGVFASPAKVMNVPEEKSGGFVVTPKDPYLAKGIFECENTADEQTLVYHVGIAYDYSKEDGTLGSLRELVSLRSNNFDCKEKVPEETFDLSSCENSDQIAASLLSEDDGGTPIETLLLEGKCYPFPGYQFKILSEDSNLGCEKPYYFPKKISGRVYDIMLDQPIDQSTVNAACGYGSDDEFAKIGFPAFNEEYIERLNKALQGP